MKTFNMMWVWSQTMMAIGIGGQISERIAHVDDDPSELANNLVVELKKADRLFLKDAKVNWSHETSQGLLIINLTRNGENLGFLICEPFV